MKAIKIGKGHRIIKEDFEFFIKYMQPKENELNLLHAYLIRDLSSIKNISYLGTKIWADQGVNLYPYGTLFIYNKSDTSIYFNF